jgi:hypothetical protein
MKIFSALTFSIIFAGALLIGSCKKEDPIVPNQPCKDSTDFNCPNYDTCFVQSEVSADFIIEYLFPSGPTWKEEQSHIWNREIRFTAIEQDANYTWYLGSEIIADKTFIRDFSLINSGTIINPILVVNKSPNLDCFPSDDGQDSIGKQLTVVGSCDYLVNNTWRGSWGRSPFDTFEITIQTYWELGTPPGDCLGLSISNINGDNGGFTGLCETDSSVGSGTLVSPRYMKFNQSGWFRTCNSPLGYAEVLPDNKTIYMEYRLLIDTDGDGDFTDEEYELEPRKFNGYAIF